MQNTNSPFFHYLLEYNTIFKENDVIYRRMAAQFGLSDSAFWILYCLRESATPLTQKQLCESIYMSKQTINSALKSLERNGFITLATGKDRRSKFLVLTEAGQELAARTVDLVIEQEQLAIASMGQESMKQFLSLFRIYTDALKQHFQTIDPESSAGDQQKENFYENPVI